MNLESLRYCRVVACFLLFLPHAVAEATRIRVGGGVLWSRAVTRSLPEYPAQSIRSGSEGLGSVNVTVDEDGAVVSVEVLEAPDSEIRTSLTTALRRWRFRPFRYKGEAVRASGRLLFYFRITDGEPEVIDAVKARLNRPPVRK